MATTIASPARRDRSRPAASRRTPHRSGAFAAVGSARVSSVLVGAVHHQGTSLPGHVAARIWPGALATLAGQLGSTVVVVGTNGKTTTAALVERMLRRPGRRPIANRSGANMVQGIVTSLVRESDLHGRLRRSTEGAPDGVFEVDELALEHVLPALGPTVIVATNLFRDQLDRYGEADSIVDRWAVALAAAAAGSVLVHCADDPRLAMLAAQLRAAVTDVRSDRTASRSDPSRVPAMPCRTRSPAGRAVASSCIAGGASGTSGTLPVRTVTSGDRRPT